MPAVERLDAVLTADKSPGGQPIRDSPPSFHPASVMSPKYGNLFGLAGVLFFEQGGFDDACCQGDYFDG